ncbi:hypothetical protein BC629DRAFT_1277804, partial [Irpex lacteus]
MRVTGKAKPRPLVPSKCITIEGVINGLRAVILLDTGSSINAMSPSYALLSDTEAFPLEKPIGLQLGCVGSRSKINYGTEQSLTVGKSSFKTYFDIVNLDHYDIVLGIPFMRQNNVVIDFTRNAIRFGTDPVPPLEGEEGKIDKLRKRWLDEYKDILSGVPERLPPMREINHAIPLIDETHIYRYHTPRCPDALKPKLLEKIQKYVRAKWWIYQNVPQAAPMLCLPK